MRVASESDYRHAGRGRKRTGNRLAYSDNVIVARGAAKGAAGGAVAGAAAGAISGNADAGAGYGAVWGATRSTIEGDREKQMVFKRCMSGRGYRVLN